MAIKIGLFAKVLVDVPGLPPLDYRIPDDLLVAVGDLVVVPLGSRRVVGVVATLANAADCEDKRLKCISAVLHATAPLNAEWLALTKFAAITYAAGVKLRCRQYQQHCVGCQHLSRRNVSQKFGMQCLYRIRVRNLR